MQGIKTKELRSVTDPRSAKRVALKKMPNVFQNLASCKRVFREIRMLASFKHDNVSSFIHFIHLRRLRARLLSFIKSLSCIFCSVSFPKLVKSRPPSAAFFAAARIAARAFKNSPPSKHASLIAYEWKPAEGFLHSAGGPLNSQRS